MLLVFQGGLTRGPSKLLNGISTIHAPVDAAVSGVAAVESLPVHLLGDELRHPLSHPAGDVSNHLLEVWLQAQEDINNLVKLRHQSHVMAVPTLHGEAPAGTTVQTRAGGLQGPTQQHLHSVHSTHQ